MSAPPEASGTSFLQYTGIPPSWLKKRPKLPSRNWLIFLSTTTSIAALYLYDRRKCKQIREEYVDKVKHLSEEVLQPLAFPRRVTVYGSKWPGDEDADRSMKYFRKYVKPILVAAAVDYEMVNGKRHGSLADILADKIKSRRRIALGLDPPPPAIPIPGHTRDDDLRRELEGGIIVVGRQTFKEFMHGLKRGWTEPLDVVDKEEVLSQELQSDGVFDEVDTSDTDMPSENPSPAEPSPAPLQKMPGSPFTYPSRLGKFPQPSTSKPESPRIDPRLNSPPATIPPYPPILLVPFTNLVGLSLIPRMIWDFFNQRRKVREGAELAYIVISGTPRPIRGPLTASRQDEVERDPSSDLSFDLQAETFYKASALVSDIEKARTSYYEALGPKIKTARELSRGEREPTKDERNFPPPTEVELRAERMNKELRWRGDLAGWAIIDPETPVAWDARFADALSVYLDEGQ